MSEEAQDFESLREILGQLVDMFILNNEFGKAEKAEIDLIKFLEQEEKNSADELMRLFHIYFAMQKRKEAVETGLKAVRCYLEVGRYASLSVIYAFIISTIDKDCREKEMIAYCYEACLVYLLDKKRSSTLQIVLAALVKQVPEFVKCSEYEKLKNEQLHLLLVENDSYNQDLLVPLVVKAHK